MIRALVGLLLLAATVSAQDHPHFFITTARETAWAQMKTDYEANTASPATLGGRLYKLMKSNADKTGTATERDEDHAEWATWMYHVTGDTTYRDKAWTKITSYFINRSVTCNNSGISGNYSREYFTTFTWEYDWLYPGLSAGQRTTFLDKLNLMAGCVNAPAPAAQYQMGFDSDQTTGEYMGLAMLHIATGSYNATVETLWNDATRFVGGLDATASDYTTYRNSIYRYVTDFSADGEWLEGYEYSNGGTIKLLIFGAEAIRSWTGTDYFPEVTTWQQAAAEQYVHMLTPASTTTSIQPKLWGDVQHPRTYRTRQYFDVAMVLAGITKGTSIGPKIQDWVVDREATVGATAADPYPRGFLMFDPYATSGDWTTIATTRYVAGAQMINARTGWGVSDSWFSAHYAIPLIADHTPTYWGEFQLWKNGKWAITHPQCYGGACIDARGSNGVTLSGVPVGNGFGPLEFRGALANRTDSTPVNYTYITGTMGGSLWSWHRYGGVVSYIMEHTRSLVWLRDWDVVVCFDRVNSKDETFPSASVSASFINWSTSRPNKELWISTPVAATITSSYTDWIYDGATAHTRVNHLLPASSTKTDQADSAITYNAGTVPSGETAWRHVTVVPDPVTNQWEPFLNVWDAYATGTPATVTLVQDSTNKAYGALVTRGSTNVLTLFNGTQGQDIPGPVPVTGGYYDWVTTPPTPATILEEIRIRNTGFEVTYTAGVDTATKIMLFDLNSTGEWTSQINGGAATPITVTAEGIGIVESSVTGSVTLTVAVTGIDLPIEITTASLAQSVVNGVYSQAIEAQFGDGGPYTCSIDSGALPAGLTMPNDTACATGITGTPTTPDNPASLIKTATQAWGNSGAASTNSLASGDGYVETVAVETTTYRMFGLSNGNTNTNYTDIDFGLYLRIDGVISVYEAGVQKYTSATGAYVTGDVMRVAVVAGAVKYSKNGTVFYTSLASPSYPLLTDTAFYTPGATLGTTSFDDGGGADPIVWTSMSGVSQTGGSASFVVEACDSVPSCTTRQYALAVRNNPIITTLTFDVGEVGAVYNDSCAASGGTVPFIFIVGDGEAPDDEAGELPPGLSLSAATCAITGTPTTLGTYAFTLRATDDAALFDDAAFEITINQASALVGMDFRSAPSANGVILTFGIAGLDRDDECVVNLLEDTAILDTTTSTSGRSRRVVYFSGLEAGKTFGVEAICGQAQSERYFFTTVASAVGGTVDWKYTAVPSAYLQALGATKLKVYYALPGEAEASETDATCTTGCTVVLSLTSGAVYNIRHQWLTAGDAVLATTQAAAVVVP
jgi:hypothetical protein